MQEIETTSFKIFAPIYAPPQPQNPTDSFVTEANCNNNTAGGKAVDVTTCRLRKRNIHPRA